MNPENPKPHTRGSHSDDINDTEPCHCKETNPENPSEESLIKAKHN